MMAIASTAVAPAAMSWSARVPKLGSVTFWLATAPAPASAKAQRAATAGEEEVDATPNMPVRAQRATIEKVTRYLRPESRLSRLSRLAIPAEPAPERQGRSRPDRRPWCTHPSPGRPPHDA